MLYIKKMTENKNVEDSLPIEVLQKGFVITDEEINKHPTLKLTVILLIKLIKKIIIYRKLKVICFQNNNLQ